jgi:hypothetical protein
MATVSVIKLKVRRGTESERRQIILDQGEIGYTTDSKRLYVGDAFATGGFPTGIKFWNINNISTPSDTTFVYAATGDFVYDQSRTLYYILTGGDYDNINSYRPLAQTVLNNTNVSSATGLVITGNLSASGSLSASAININANNITSATTITQAGTGFSFRVNDAVSDTTPFIIANNGHVIIGGTAAPPSPLLTIYGDVSAGINPSTGFGGSFINGNNAFLAANRSDISTTLTSFFGTSILLKANSTYELEYNLYTQNKASQTYTYKLSANRTMTNVVAALIQDTSGTGSADINTYATTGASDGPIINFAPTNAITNTSTAVYGQVRALVQTGVDNATILLALSTSNALGATPLQGSYRKVTQFSGS